MKLGAVNFFSPILIIQLYFLLQIGNIPLSFELSSCQLTSLAASSSFPSGERGCKNPTYIKTIYLNISFTPPFGIICVLTNTT